jgi:hypothetical protein
MDLPVVVLGDMLSAKAKEGIEQLAGNGPSGAKANHGEISENQ